MNRRLFFLVMAVAASVPMLLACAGAEFVADDSTLARDADLDTALYDEPLIVRFDAGSPAGPLVDARAAQGIDGANCDGTKSPHEDPCVIDDALGVFVAPIASGGSDASGDGTMAGPYATIGHALSNLGSKSRVYVCNAVYTERVTVLSALSLYGGLACPGGDAGAPWSYVGGRAQVTGPTNQIALAVEEVSGPVDIEDMFFLAPNGSGQDTTGNGQSSLAALIDQSTVTLHRCVLEAGSGDQGTDGSGGSNYVGKLAPDGRPNDAGAGGFGGSILCSNGTSSAGGPGGSHNPSPPQGNGGAGTSSPSPPTSSARNGAGGVGDDGVNSCHGGYNGADGIASSGGVAAGVAGTLTTAGWTPTPGGAGGSGNPAQGGGGAGGNTAPPFGGTGGGSGGCGGGAGGGGNGGGASIALACISSSVTLDTCTFVTSSGGNGGKGADGQPGQGGGAGPRIAGTCAGGYGGNGAGGGGGAGGTGGISVDIAYRGSPPTGMRFYTTGSAGQPGSGGAGGAGGSNALGSGPSGPNGSAGLAGVAASTWQVQ